MKCNFFLRNYWNYCDFLRKKGWFTSEKDLLCRHKRTKIGPISRRGSETADQRVV